MFTTHHVHDTPRSRQTTFTTDHVHDRPRSRQTTFHDRPRSQ